MPYGTEPYALAPYGVALLDLTPQIQGWADTDHEQSLAQTSVAASSAVTGLERGQS